MSKNGNIYIHFIDSSSNKVLNKQLTCSVPRVGDELRLREDTYYKVTLVVWVYDEPEFTFDRVNIGVDLIY